MKYCPNCGASIQDNANFCPHCGTGFGAPQQPYYQQQPYQQPYQQGYQQGYQQQPRKQSIWDKMRENREKSKNMSPLKKILIYALIAIGTYLLIQFFPIS